MDWPRIGRIARMLLKLGLATLIASALVPCTEAQTTKAKLEFEVASVRENKTGEPSSSNVPLGPGPQFDAKGGLLVAKDQPLLGYIVFAFKPDMRQIGEFRAQLPDWARTAHFDIEARADGNPTKDDLRQMMQSLLEERFHLVAHRETREEPVFAVVFAKPGKLGPRLRPHPADDPGCAKTTFAKTAGGGAYPVACGASASIVPEVPGDLAEAGYNVTMDDVALALGGTANLTDRRVVNRTGLPGTYDFTLEFTPESALNAQPDADAGPGGTSFTEAVKSQLGLKLALRKLANEVIVIDRLERPSEN
jgi:uncharacterized protein (TIGR03435 family)